jgi:flagellar motor switch protein FliG
MNAIEQGKPPPFENIRRFMFVFKDLENLDSTVLSKLMSRAVPLLLPLMAQCIITTEVLATQSQRGAAMMTEEISSLGPVKLKDIYAAQQEITTLPREMEKKALSA